VSQDLKPSTPSSGYHALLHNAAYRTLLSSEVLGHVGWSLYFTVLPWLLLDLTGSNSAPGWATTAVYLPFLLLAVPAGTLVDRVDRRRLLIAANALRAVLAAVAPLLYMARVLTAWHVLFSAFCLSAMNLVSYLARASLLPQIVPQREILTANSANLGVLGLATIAGAAAVGPVVRTLGLVNASAVVAVALMVAAALAALLRLPPEAARAAKVDPLTWVDLLRGVSYVLRDPLVRILFLLDALYFVLGDGMLRTGLPLFVKDVLGAGPEVYGYLRTAGNAGMLLGALWLGRYGKRFDKRKLVVLAWMGYGLSQLGFPLFRSIAPALAASFFSLLIGNAIPACEGSLLQEKVPQEVLGRVFGVWNMIAPGSGAFSGLIGGAVAGAVPATTLIAFAAGVSCFNVVLGVAGGLWRGEAASAAADNGSRQRGSG
jgi:MFS family permease